jgi:hypothetical protein
MIQVFAKVTSGEGLPPALLEALREAVREAVQPLRDDIANLSERLSTKISNGTIVHDDELLVPPSNAANDPVPEHFPTTIVLLRNLQAGQELIDLENYYYRGEAHTGTLLARRRRVATAYGVRITF